MSAQDETESGEDASTPVEELGAIEEMSLADLLGRTVTATGTELTLEEAPSIVEVITHRDIRRRGYRTVADALRHVAGVHVITDHLYHLAGVRGIFSATGTPNDGILVMINGQEAAFRPTGGHFLGHELVPIEAVERIEVLRGPASALYGANAFLGVINVITWQGRDAERSRRPRHALAVDYYVMQSPQASTLNGATSFFSAAEEGSFRFLSAGVFHYADRSGLIVPGSDDITRGTLHRNDPMRYPPPLRFPTPALDEDARRFIQENPFSRFDTERTASLYALGAYRFDDAELSLDGHLQYFDRFAEWQDFTYLTHGTRITHLLGFARMRLQLGRPAEPGELAGGASVTFSSGSPTGDERIVDRLIAGTYARRRFGSNAVQIAAQGDYTFAPRSSIRFGADYVHDFEDLLAIETVNPTTGAVADDGGFAPREFANVGAVLQLTWNPWDRLQLTAGSRVDHNTAIACNTRVWNCLGALGEATEPSFEPGRGDILITDRGAVQLSNRAAVVYELPWAGLYAKLIYGSSFKPPSPFQLFRRRLTISGSSVGNPALQPQTANTLELQLGIRPVPGLHAWVVGFSTWVDDMVMFSYEQGRLVGRNADVEVQGMEASLSYAPDDVASFFVNGTFLVHSAVRPEQRRDETDAAWQASPLNDVVPLGGYPDVAMNAGVHLHFPSVHLDVSFALRLVGPRRASFVNNQAFHRTLDRTYELPLYLDTDLTVSTVGWRPLGGNETAVSLSLRGVPGGYAEAGVGGIDLPSLGPRVHLRLSQEL